MTRNHVAASSLSPSVATLRVGLLFFVSTILLTQGFVASAQIENVTNSTSTPIQGAGHDYIKMLSETVNPANGSVSVRIQTPTPSGRGISLPFSFAYDSNGEAHLTSDFSGNGYWIDNSAYLGQGGWSYSAPLLSNILVETEVQRQGRPPSFCGDYRDYVFQDATGGRHSLDVAFVVSSMSVCDLLPLPPTTKLTGGDDYYQATIGSTTQSLATIVDSAGTVYTFPALAQNHESPGNGFLPSSSLPSLIEDRNGNQIVVTDLGLQTNGVVGAFTVTDPLGRTLLSSSGFGVSGNTVTVSGVPEPYIVTWGPFSANFAPNYVLTNPGQTCGAILSDTSTRNKIKNLQLPNGQSYQFSYESTYGMVNQITYPNGGYVHYTWGVNSLSEAAAYEELHIYLDNCWYQYDVPAVTQRTVSFDGVHTALTQTFTYTTTWGSDPRYWSSKTTTVKTTDNVTGLVSINVYTYTPVPGPYQVNDSRLFSAQIPVEQTVVYENAGGTALRSTNKIWYDQYQLKNQQTVLSDSSASAKPMSQITYTYGAGAQVTDKKEYDYGAGAPGTLLRNTVTNYQSFVATPIYPTAASIFNKPCQNIVYDGSGNRYSETDYFYDNGSTSTVCGTAGTPSVTGVASLTGHDETNYGASSTAPRGNLTQKTQYSSAGTTPITTFTYDESGQVLSMTDACGNASCSDMTGSTHTTSYSYANSYTILSGGQNVGYTPSGNTNAYLTKRTDALGHTEQFTYDYNVGQLTVSTDENTQSTTYLYNDPFSRPKQVNYPDGGLTTLAYNDAPYNGSWVNPSPSVTTTKAMLSALNEVSTVAFDGMGHTVGTILSSDPDGTTYTATTYAGTGKPYQSYNPTRCSTPTSNCGETTWGVTTNTYDVLGRTTQVAEPDGSKVLTSYSGNQTTVTDEAGNQRTSQVDGVGRLTSVLEAPNNNGYGFPTTYAYDPLNDLTSVTQKGNSGSSGNWRPRSFVYDSLARLTSASNPESGTILYSYDANSNLSTRIAPSPNQPATGTATVTTSYSYDVLNRITGKSYADTYTNNPITPGVMYGYDGSSLSSCPTPIGWASTGTLNGIGRRTAMCFGAGNKSWQIDPMGRIVTENTRFIGLVGPPWGSEVHLPPQFTVPTISTNTAYTYYLNGDLYDTYYPMGPTYEFRTTESAAGRVITAGDVLYNVFNEGTYSPAGQLASAYIENPNGGTGAVGVSNSYNNRLQPVTMSATTGSTSILNLTYNFGLGNGTSGTDNGNLLSVTNANDGIGAVNYTYDPLNRISSAYTTGPTWGENYTIDPWGNLTNISGYTGKGSSETLTCAPANTQNQLNTCFTYDAAGNVIQNGTASYVYDAENRLISAGGFTYMYDGDGVRIEKCTEGSQPGMCASNATGTFYWKHIDGSTLAETDLGENPTAVYGPVRGQIYHRVDISGTTYSPHYYFHDFLRSTNLVVNSSNTIQQETDYYPYGGEIPIIAGDSNRYRFTGKEHDAETGLDFFGARHYASTMGRFMTPDWAAKPTNVPYASFGNPQSLNLYGYVKNNPTTVGDPDGHCPDACMLEAAAAGLVLAYLASPPGQQILHNATNDIVSVVSALSSLYQPSNSGLNTAPPPTMPTNVSQGTPASTSQQGAVNNDPINSRTLEPGPNATDGIPARGPGRDFTQGERDAINQQGQDTGCHTCGTKDAGTKSGNFVPDHQPPSALNTEGADQRLYPQCLQCSRTQGGEVNAAKQALQDQSESGPDD
jgi:RHS repeat-associated protein